MGIMPPLLGCICCFFPLFGLQSVPRVLCSISVVGPGTTLRIMAERAQPGCLIDFAVCLLYTRAFDVPCPLSSPGIPLGTLSPSGPSGRNWARAASRNNLRLGRSSAQGLLRQLGGPSSSPSAQLECKHIILILSFFVTSVSLPSRFVLFYRL